MKRARTGFFALGTVAFLGSTGCSSKATTGAGGRASSGTASSTATSSQANVTANGTGTGTASGTTTTTSTSSGGPLTDFTAGGSRPTTVYVPPSYDPTKPAPLLILLHGYTATGAIQEAYLQLLAVTKAHGMLYAHPDGTKDTTGEEFWNATDACCNLYGSTVDDSAYLIGLVNEIKSKANIDPKRVYFMGHSNGGFMSYRMACDHAADIAAIVSVAGATFSNISKCAPTSPVSILEIHGTGDATILYNGGTIGANAYPSADTTVLTWAGYDGCGTTPDTSRPPLDLDSSVPGNESTLKVYGQGCMAGGHAELWTIPGAPHIPTLSATFSEQAVSYLLAHPKP